MTSLTIAVNQGGQDFTVILAEVDFNPMNLRTFSIALSTMAGLPFDPFIGALSSFLGHSDLPCLASSDPCSCGPASVHSQLPVLRPTASGKTAASGPMDKVG